VCVRVTFVLVPLSTLFLLFLLFLLSPARRESRSYAYELKKRTREKGEKRKREVRKQKEA
jgi:cbb3-type cytochrome oxidase subunit 3